MTVSGELCARVADGCEDAWSRERGALLADRYPSIAAFAEHLRAIDDDTFLDGLVWALLDSWRCSAAGNARSCRQVLRDAAVQYGGEAS